MNCGKRQPFRSFFMQAHIRRFLIMIKIFCKIIIEKKEKSFGKEVKAMNDENIYLIEHWEDDFTSLIDDITEKTAEDYRGIETGGYREALWQIIKSNVKEALNDWMLEIIQYNEDDKVANNIYRLYKESIRYRNGNNISKPKNSTHK